MRKIYGIAELNISRVILLGGERIAFLTEEIGKLI